MSLFIPHAACSVSSGDCFRLGRCLDGCRSRNSATVDQRLLTIEERCAILEQRIILLERNVKP